MDQGQCRGGPTLQRLSMNYDDMQQLLNVASTMPPAMGAYEMIRRMPKTTDNGPLVLDELFKALYDIANRRQSEAWQLQDINHRPAIKAPVTQARIDTMCERKTDEQLLADILAKAKRHL